jgi:hypothetical protein
VRTPEPAGTTTRQVKAQILGFIGYHVILRNRSTGQEVSQVRAVKYFGNSSIKLRITGPRCFEEPDVDVCKFRFHCFPFSGS